MLARLVAVTALLASTAASAQQLPPNYLGRVGGVTTEVCAVPVITPSSAYSAGNSVGGLITLPAAFLSTNSGILQAVRLTSKSAQTLEFDVTFFSALPSTTFTDKTAPAIVAADALLAQPPMIIRHRYRLWREWRKGAVITDQTEIELLESHAAPVERINEP